MPNRDLNRLRQDIVFEEKLKDRAYTFPATWGLFNPKRVDPGTRLLIDYLEAAPTDRCLDLGCGYGPVGLALGHQCPEGAVQMIDKDFVAIDYANANAGNTLDGTDGRIAVATTVTALKGFEPHLAELRPQRKNLLGLSVHIRLRLALVGATIFDHRVRAAPTPDLARQRRHAVIEP